MVKMMDMDNDGTIDGDERALLQSITRKNDPDMHRPMVHLVDLDGDGVVSAEEAALLSSIADVDGDGQVNERDVYLAKIQFRCNKIKHADVVDVSGDGKISDLELRHAREAAGRKYVIEDFIQQNWHQMAEMNPLFRTMSRKEQRQVLFDEFDNSGCFADVHKELEERQHVMRRSTSSQVRHSLLRKPGAELPAGPSAGSYGTMRKQSDGPWARRLAPEEHSLEHHGYSTARRVHEDRLERCFTARLPEPERPNALGTRFSKDKGNIPGYGNFSAYGSFMVKVTGKTFSNTR